MENVGEKPEWFLLAAFDKVIPVDELKQQLASLREETKMENEFKPSGIFKIVKANILRSKA